MRPQRAPIRGQRACAITLRRHQRAQRGPSPRLRRCSHSDSYCTATAIARLRGMRRGGRCNGSVVGPARVDPGDVSAMASVARQITHGSGPPALGWFSETMKRRRARGPVSAGRWSSAASELSHHRRRLCGHAPAGNHAGQGVRCSRRMPCAGGPSSHRAPCT